MNDSKILKIISESLKNSGKHIVIRDKENNIVFPKEIEEIAEVERIMKLKSKGKEFYDKKTGNNYVIKSSIFYDKNNEYIFDLIENNTNYKKIEEKSKYDTPTKLLNKDTILTILDNCILNRDNSIHSLSVCVCDIDLFKSINDTYGHLAGDKILECIAKIFKTYESEYISIGRFGGDEFIFIINNKTSDEVLDIMNEIKDKVENTKINFDNQIINDITMSFGICFINELSRLKFSNLNEILNKRKNIFYCADEALYESKQKGRNRITIVYG